MLLSLVRCVPAMKKSSRPLSIDRGVAEKLLLDLKDRLDQAPKNARLDLERREVIESVPGFGLEPYGSISVIESFGVWFPSLWTTCNTYFSGSYATQGSKKIREIFSFLVILYNCTVEFLYFSF